MFLSALRPTAFFSSWFKGGSLEKNTFFGRSLLLAALTTLIALLGTGAGYLNGDAACYAAQGWAGALAPRVVHVGWTSLATLLAPWAGDRLPVWLDVMTALAAGIGVATVGRISRSWMGAGIFMVTVLPLSSFAEVDVPWVALLLLSVVVPSTGLSMGLALLSVSVSPTALLALPWASYLRWRERPRGWWAPGAGALLAVLLLTGGSAGEWWTGDRGILVGAGRQMPGRVLRASLQNLPMLLLVSGLWSRVRWPFLLLLPLLMVPPDVPTWLWSATGLALVVTLGEAELEKRGRRRDRVLMTTGHVFLLIYLLFSVSHWWKTVERVRDENRVMKEVVTAMKPEDGLIASWGWGVRASVIATGDPYQLPWRVPGPPGPDKVAGWCARHFSRIAVLPPTATSPAATAAQGEGGVWWSPGDDPVWAQLPGCKQE